MFLIVYLFFFPINVSNLICNLSVVFFKGFFTEASSFELFPATVAVTVYWGGAKTRRGTGLGLQCQILLQVNYNLTVN